MPDQYGPRRPKAQGAISITSVRQSPPSAASVSPNGQSTPVDESLFSPTGKPQLESYEVVHLQVVIRSLPSTGSKPKGMVKKGDILDGEVRGEWLLLDTGLGSSELARGEGRWVLINGRSLGFGALLERHVSAPAPALDQVGVSINSVVGGSGAGRTVPQPQREGITPVVWWGICDVKYDSRLPPRDQVKLLELGDGRSSRFSDHGTAIKDRFDSKYYLEKVPLKRSLMVENKKLTHDIFVSEGFGHLRPRQYSYPRHYTPELAGRIAEDLGASEADSVVLKLCNRTRGAGVVVCPVSQLDATLRDLLTPPAGKALDKWIQDQAAQLLEPRGDADAGMLAEEQRHYWSNECPVFIVEELCHSQPIRMPGAEEEGDFDATMRVAFALRRLDGNSERPYEIDWLGGYWKLPPAPANTEAANTLEALRDSLVSSFNSVDKRTAAVPEEDFEKVCEALTPALPRVFFVAVFGLKKILNTKTYWPDPLYHAFVTTKSAAEICRDDLKGASFALEQARKMADKAGASSQRVASDGSDKAQRRQLDLPESSVLSYIDRTAGVISAIKQDWTTASASFAVSVLKLPTNATAHYLRGVALQEQGNHEEAAQCHVRSIALDPDFKSPYSALSVCKSELGSFRAAMDASIACLRRHPDTPMAQYYVGQAIYQQLRSGSWRGSASEDAALRRKASEALEIAKARMPEMWTSAHDDAMLTYLGSTDAAAREKLPKQAVNSFKVYGWRA